MVDRNIINLSSLDFDDYKENLKEYLKNQNEFSDYDFEGSALNILLTILSYNANMLSYYSNMIVNESTLESAQIRNNLVSRAKMFSYTPRSKTAPSAYIKIEISGDSDSPGTINIPKNTKFESTVNSVSYTFNTIEATSVNKDANNNYVANNVQIKEGEPLEYRFEYNSNNPDQKFIIPNEDIDTSTLEVTVQNSENDKTRENFLLADEIVTVNGNSSVYWLQEANDGYFEIEFGDGVIGKELSNKNIIICEYLATNDKEANKANTFSPVEEIAGFFDEITVTTVSEATGGDERETDDSIRFLSPRHYSSQNRGVAAGDYKSLISSLYSNIDAIRVWGGEDHIPPTYGKVFITIKPKTGSVLSDSEKSFIKNEILKKRRVVSIEPEFVDPEYFYIMIDSTVKYEKKLTSKTADEIKDEVKTTISNYSNNDLNVFDSYFRYSNLTSKIDNTDISIKNNLTTIKLYHKVTPTLGESDTYTIEFKNAIENPFDGYEGAVTSNYFTHENSGGTSYTYCIIEDDGTPVDGKGTLKIKQVNQDTGTKTIIESDVGTVNYSTGKITITSPFKPTALNDTTLNIIVEPDNNDIIPVREQVLVINDDDITITITEDDEDD